MISLKWFVSSFPPTLILRTQNTKWNCLSSTVLLETPSFFLKCGDQPAYSVLHFLPPAVRDDVCEGEATVYHDAAQLRAVLLEVVVRAQRPRWNTQNMPDQTSASYNVWTFKTTQNNYANSENTWSHCRAPVSLHSKQFTIDSQCCLELVLLK